MSAILCSRCSRSLWHIVRHYSFKLNPKAVVIAAAVRTPNTLQHVNEEHRLTGMVIDELVKRTAVPRDEFKKLIVCSSSDMASNDALSSMARNLGLKSCQTHAIKDEACSVSGLQMSLECLQRDEEDWIILGDTRTNIKHQAGKILASELMTAAVPVRKTPAVASSSENVAKSSSGAAALALTTAQMAERLQLQPLALVREFFIEQDNLQAIFRLNNSQPIQLKDVHSWELVMPQQQHENLSMLDDLNVNEVHTHDISQITATHLLTHTVHALPAGSLGCVVMESSNGECLLMVLEKLVPKPENLPQLTLYTKEPCPLCDDLVAQLERNFAGEFELKKVFIDRKENVRYLRLFRHDIPVLFLNGQFLCMHRLNEEVLRERLVAIKSGGAEEKKT
ncbi:hypothetical protein ACLKA6_001060 [Drosophila palustris]